MKVLIANPFFFKHSELERKFKTFYFPLGLLYLAAAARQAGHQVEIFDGTFADGIAEFEESVERFQPQAVCLGSWITVQPYALELAAIAARHAAKTILGGPGPTASPARYLESEAVDFVVIGEGERTLVELLSRLESARPPTDVLGLAFRDGGGTIQRTDPRPLIHDLDELPLPARDLIEVDRHLAMWQEEQGYRSISLAISRGCPDDSCPYCADSVMGPGLRLRGIEDIVAEMRHLQAAYDIDRFRLVDDLNRLDRQWLRDLGEAMIAAGVNVPYEGLNTIKHRGLPMLAETRDICHERNAWIPTQGKHGHAPPIGDLKLVRRRWERALLLPTEHLEDP